MDFKQLFLSLALFTTIINAETPQAEITSAKTAQIAPTQNFQFMDLEYCIKGLLADVITILTIDLNQYKELNSTLPKNHISNAYRFLQQFYQEDRDYYRKGGSCPIALTTEQIDALLICIRGSNTSLPDYTPTIKKEADAILFGGTAWSVKKRFFSFKHFLQAGFTCKKLFLLCTNATHTATMKQLIEENKDLFKDIELCYIQATCDINERENFIEQIKDKISKEFYLISDPEYAENLQGSCIHFGTPRGLTLLGTFARTVTRDIDEYVTLDLQGYKFDEFITDPAAQRKAAACSSLNLLEHQVIRDIALLPKASNQ